MTHLKSALALVLFAVVGLGLGLLARDVLSRSADAVDIVAIDRSIAGVPATDTPVMLSLSTCPVCKQARNWLQARGIKYTEMALDESDEARLLADRLGVLAVPVFLVGEQQITGFDPKQLEPLLVRR